MTLTRKGWNSLKPITAPEQMSTPIHWNPMSDDWKRWIDSHQVYNGESRFSKEMLDAMKALHDKILGFGGDEVCMTAYDEDLSLIHISEPTRRTPISYAVFCLKKKK